jgi:hypothetical protein
MSVVRNTAIAICLVGTAAIAARSSAAGPLATGIAALSASDATDIVRTRANGWDWRGGRGRGWFPPVISDELAARLALGGYYPYARYPYYLPYYYYSYPAFSSYGYVYPYYGGYSRFGGHAY